MEARLVPRTWARKSVIAPVAPGARPIPPTGKVPSSTGAPSGLAVANSPLVKSTAIHTDAGATGRPISRATVPCRFSSGRISTVRRRVTTSSKPISRATPKKATLPRAEVAVRVCPWICSSRASVSQGATQSGRSGISRANRRIILGLQNESIILNPSYARSLNPVGFEG